jgi:hypothetical protein
MSRLTIVAVTVSGLLLFGQPTALAQGPTPPAKTPTDAIVTMFHAGCRAVAKRPDLRMRFEDRGAGMLAVEVVAADGTSLPEPMASAELWLGEGGRLLRFRLGPGKLVGSERSEALRRQLEALPALDIQIVEQRLVEHRALLPPSAGPAARRRAQAFLRDIAPVVGNAQITSVEFYDVPPVPPPSTAMTPWDPEPRPSRRVLLGWLVRASTGKGDLAFTIDAVTGNVVSAH